MSNDDQRIEQLEVKVAFLENALSELSDEYYAQQKQLEKLKLQLEGVIEKFTKLDQSGEGDTIVDERPPHY